MFYLFIFEFLGTTELMVILVFALILFGPRRLPQMTRSVGKSLGEFKRASEEFKQTWEREVSLENVEKERQIEQAMLPADNSILAPTVGREKSLPAPAAELKTEKAEDEISVAALDAPLADAVPAASTLSAMPAPPAAPVVSVAQTNVAAPEPTRKREWL